MVTFNSQQHLQARLKELMNQQGCLATYCVVQDLRQVSVFFFGGMCVLVCRLHIVCICIQHIYIYICIIIKVVRCFFSSPCIG